MGQAFIIMGAGRPSTGTKEGGWGPDSYEELGRLAAQFKQNGDTGGVHLCALVEEEMRAVDAGKKDCRATGIFYLALAISRQAEGADHELAHMLLPQIQEVMQEANREAQLERLKMEVADVELDT